ncbi:hypothetical protein HPB50_002007 [Hyalomma asiaticum]|uniref:Uncharacterized protein n=1 Tax=Hyalomma asiaticum TaxID=266040 RepID=A0ACB7RWF9_HYAAI|nr:hypothetical protein HPB50_002007 [Hyalomma asiaticum]
MEVTVEGEDISVKEIAEEQGWKTTHARNKKNRASDADVERDKQGDAKPADADQHKRRASKNIQKMNRFSDRRLHTESNRAEARRSGEGLYSHQREAEALDNGRERRSRSRSRSRTRSRSMTRTQGDGPQTRTSSGPRARSSVG